MTDSEGATWSAPPAWGVERVVGSIKSQPEDFVVREVPNWTPSGDGEHAVLWVEKVGLNTEWLARQLARFAGVANRCVSYAGRKDRLARTWQWFSVHLPGADVDWSGFECEGAIIHRAERHSRKIRTGALKGNAFEIVIRELDFPIHSSSVELLRRGVPNYFGPQRFGNNQSNLKSAVALAAGRRIRKNERQLAISAARSALFNEILAARVADQSWSEPVVGDVVQFEGNRSVYAVDADSLEETLRRADALDLHPTGPLWGRGETTATGPIGALEQTVAETHPMWAKATEVAGAAMARRALRVLPRGLEFSLTDQTAELAFELPAGAFATVLLNELMIANRDQRSKT